MTSTRLRKRSIVSALPGAESDGESGEVGIQYCPGEVVGGGELPQKECFFITEDSCILADRRMTSLRQQSDQILSVVGPENIAASASTVYRHREKMRMKALQRSETLAASSNAIQLCYDGKIIDKINRYVFVAQFVNVGDAKTEQVVGVKSFGNDQSVTAEALFNAISDVCSGILQNAHSVMAGTTALNTGKISGVNKRLQDYVRIIAGHGIHEFECLFHVNEVYLTHAITAVKGKKKGPGAMQDGAILNKIKNIEKPNIDDLDPNQSFQVSVTKMASIQVTAKLDWFSQQQKKRHFRWQSAK